MLSTGASTDVLVSRPAGSSEFAGVNSTFKTLLLLPAASAAAKQPFTYSDVPVPAFPERSEAEEHELEPGVVQRVVALGEDEGGFYDKPGHGGYMYLYLPPGEHAPKSLPCVLIAPAGSTLLAGMGLGEGDEPEHIPYVKAGCAVLSYELDGPCYDDSDADERALDPVAFGRRAGVLVRSDGAARIVDGNVLLKHRRTSAAPRPG